MNYFCEAAMAERNQVNITLSDPVLSEYEEVATWLGIPVRTFIRQVVEGYHRKEEFGALLIRCRSGERPPTAPAP
jgi:predicted DNA binding CopG/RHH family protein